MSQAKHLVIPGMIEPSERNLIYKFSSIQKDSIVEVGSFIGASTVCMCEASIKNGFHPLIYSFDPHEVPWTDPWHASVLDWANRLKCRELLSITSSGIDFSKIFEKNTKGYPFLNYFHSPFTSECTSNLPSKIGLLFRDLSKDWQDFIPIFGHLFPRLSEGSNVIFQDYGYREGLDVLAIASLLCDQKFMEPIETAATSACFIVKRSFHVEDMSRIVSFFTSKKIPIKELQNLINMTVNMYEQFSLRKDVMADVSMSLLAFLKEQGFPREEWIKQSKFLKLISNIATTETFIRGYIA